MASGASTPDVGAVVVTHANVGLAIECVRSLQTEVPKALTVVVVNAPERADQPRLRELETMATVLRNPGPPRGYGANLNAGVAALSGTLPAHLLLSNDDVVYPDGAVAALVAALRTAPAAGLIGPAIVSAQGRREPSSFRFPSIGSELAQLAMLPEAWSARLRQRYAHPAPPTVERVDWVLGASMLIRSDAFAAVGGLDPSFFLYSEETDLCWRLARAGYQTLSAGAVEVVHVGAASTDGGHGALMGRSRGMLLAKHWPAGRRLALVVLVYVVGAFNIGYAVVRTALDPRSGPSRRRLWTDHWATRPRFRVRSAP